MTKDIATVKAALEITEHPMLLSMLYLGKQEAFDSVTIVNKAARAYVEIALSSPPAIELEAKRDALNKIDDALLLFRNDKPYTSGMMPSIAFSKDELLSLRAIHQQPCEAESLKRHNYKDRSYVDYGCPKSEEDGWNDCIDHLAATGKLGGDDLGELLKRVPDKCGCELRKAGTSGQWAFKIFSMTADTIYGEGTTPAEAVRKALDTMKDHPNGQ